MELLSQIWPFPVGHQQMIFNFSGTVVLGLILLNIFSAFRQKLPIQKIISSLFTEVGTQNQIEKLLRVLLIALLVLSFIVLVIDTQVNGIQIITLQSK